MGDRQEPLYNKKFHKLDPVPVQVHGQNGQDFEETRYFERILFGEYHIRVRPTDLVLQHTAYHRVGKQADAIMEVRALVKDLREKFGCTEMEITRALQCAFDEDI
jgi:hypothetical protein